MKRATRSEVSGLQKTVLRLRHILDHGVMHNARAKVFRCARYKQAGRDQRPVFFTCIPDYGRIDRERMGEERHQRCLNDPATVGRLSHGGGLLTAAAGSIPKPTSRRRQAQIRLVRPGNQSSESTRAKL